MIVVTGASGLIGRAIAARALRQGQAVRLQGRSAHAVAEALSSVGVRDPLEVVELDLKSADQSDIDRLMNGCTSVVHCAGLVHQPKAPAAHYEALNYRATQMVAAAAKRARAESFVFFSTSAVYGGGPFANVDEDTADPNPDTPYGISKLRSELWLKENPPSPNTVVLRPSLVFGEGDRGNFLSLMKQINKGMYFHIGGNKAQKSVIFSADVALAVERCLALEPGYHLFNLANPRTIDVIELSNAIALCLGRMPPPTVPERLVRAGAMVGGAILGNKSPLTVQKMDKLMTTTTCSVKKLVAATGFSPAVPLDQAIRAEIEWARASGLLGSSELRASTS